MPPDLPAPPEGARRPSAFATPPDWSEPAPLTLAYLVSWHIARDRAMAVVRKSVPDAQPHEVFTGSRGLSVRRDDSVRLRLSWSDLRDRSGRQTETVHTDARIRVRPTGVARERRPGQPRRRRTSTSRDDGSDGEPGPSSAPAPAICGRPV